MSEILDSVKDDALEAAENLAEKLISKHYDSVMAEVLEEVKELIPGDKYDFLADLLIDKMAPLGKAKLLALAEKIKE